MGKTFLSYRYFSWIIKLNRIILLEVSSGNSGTGKDDLTWQFIYQHKEKKILVGNSSIVEKGQWHATTKIVKKTLLLEAGRRTRQFGGQHICRHRYKVGWKIYPGHELHLDEVDQVGISLLSRTLAPPKSISRCTICQKLRDLLDFWFPGWTGKNVYVRKPLTFYTSAVPWSKRRSQLAM